MRSRTNTATSGASVFPAAMHAATSNDELMGAFTRKAPIAIAGQKRRPRRNSTATAMPVGGQMGVT